MRKFLVRSYISALGKERFTGDENNGYGGIMNESYPVRLMCRPTVFWAYAPTLYTWRS
jgi:hypothetical protein